MTLAAGLAVADLIEGQNHQEMTNSWGNHLCQSFNQVIEKYGVALEVENFGSMCYFRWPQSWQGEELFAAWMRSKLIYLQAGMPFFVSAALSALDLDYIISGFESVIKEMIQGDLLPVLNQKERS